MNEENSKRKIYISGPITGIPEETAKKAFADAQEKLEKKGYSVFNPMNFPHNHNKSWAAYMREDLKEMLECDSIFMLPGWERSHGAKIEHRLATQLCFIVIYE